MEKDGYIEGQIFVGNSSLFRRIFIFLTAVTPCEDTFKQISLTPSNSRHLITSFDEVREGGMRGHFKEIIWSRFHPQWN